MSEVGAPPIYERVEGGVSVAQPVEDSEGEGRGEGPPRGGGTLNAGWSNTYAVPNRGLAGNDGGIPEVRKV